LEGGVHNRTRGERDYFSRVPVTTTMTVLRGVGDISEERRAHDAS
jgi:hypothetical protein